MATTEKDPELHTFASGTRRFDRPSPTLEWSLEVLRRGLAQKPYRRTKKQMDDVKVVSDRIMGERSDQDA